MASISASISKNRMASAALIAAAGVLGAGAGCGSLPSFGPRASTPAPDEVPLRIVARAPAAPLELPISDSGQRPASAGSSSVPAPATGSTPPGSSPDFSNARRVAASPIGAGSDADPAERPSARDALLATLDGRVAGRIEDVPGTGEHSGSAPKREISVSQVSFAAEGGDFAPVLDRNAEFIVFASTQHRATFDLYRKSVQGRAVTLLTDDPGDDMMPALSPDGSRLAFASNRNGNWDVFVMPADGGPAVQVTSEGDDETHPTWAPDGRRLALSRRNARTGQWELWIVDAENPGVRTFVCEGFQPRWSPDAERDRLLFQRARQRGSRLYSLWTVDLVDGEGRNPTEIVSARNAAVVQPAWSPDGTRIAFATVVNPDVEGEWPEQSDVWVVQADGSGRTAVTSGSHRNMQPAWGADGRIYFTSNRNGTENIWATSVDRSARTSTSMTAGARAAGSSGVPRSSDSTETGGDGTQALVPESP